MDSWEATIDLVGTGQASNFKEDKEHPKYGRGVVIKEDNTSILTSKLDPLAKPPFCSSGEAFTLIGQSKLDPPTVKKTKSKVSKPRVTLRHQMTKPKVDHVCLDVGSCNETKKTQKKTKTSLEYLASLNFKRTRLNTYNGVKKAKYTEDNLCTCILKTPEGKCADQECLNRCMLMECPSACGDQCLNRRIQNFQWAPQLVTFRTEYKGLGVKTMQGIKKGDFVLEYTGEVVTKAIFMQRMRTVYAEDNHHFCLQLDGDLVIDSHRTGGKGRFVNHSCEPNCEIQKWLVNGHFRMALFAIKDIVCKEELSYDYNFSLFNTSNGQLCRCESLHCRGTIREKGMKESKSGENLTTKLKGLTPQEKNFVREHACFLVRNRERYIRQCYTESNSKKKMRPKYERC